MKLRPSTVLIVLVLLICSSASNFGYGFGFSDLSIRPDWIKVDGEVTSAILSKYSDKALIAESFRYKETESIIVRVFPAFSLVAVKNDHRYCISEAQDIIIPKYDFSSGEAHGKVYRYPGVTILYALRNRSQKCAENLEVTDYFYALNSRVEPLVKLLPHISEKTASEFCQIDMGGKAFNTNLISFHKKSLPLADTYLKTDGSLSFAVGGTVYQLFFSLDVDGAFTVNSCQQRKEER